MRRTRPRRQAQGAAIIDDSRAPKMVAKA